MPRQPLLGSTLPRPPMGTGAQVGALALQRYQIERAAREDARRNAMQQEQLNFAKSQAQYNQKMEMLKFKTQEQIRKDHEKRLKEAAKTATKGIGKLPPLPQMEQPPAPPAPAPAPPVAPPAPPAGDRIWGPGQMTPGPFDMGPQPPSDLGMATGITPGAEGPPPPAEPGISQEGFDRMWGTGRIAQAQAAGAVPPPVGAVAPPPVAAGPPVTPPTAPPPAVQPSAVPSPFEGIDTEATRRLRDVQTRFQQAVQAAQVAGGKTGLTALRAAQKARRNEEEDIRRWRFSAYSDARKAQRAARKVAGKEAREAAEDISAEQQTRLVSAVDSLEELDTLVKSGKVNRALTGVASAITSRRAQFSALRATAAAAAKVKDERGLAGFYREAKGDYTAIVAAAQRKIAAAVRRGDEDAAGESHMAAESYVRMIYDEHVAAANKLPDRLVPGAVAKAGEWMSTALSSLRPKRLPTPGPPTQEALNEYARLLGVHKDDEKKATAALRKWAMQDRGRWRSFRAIQRSIKGREAAMTEEQGLELARKIAPTLE